MTQLTIYFEDADTALIVERLCELLPGVLSLDHDEYENDAHVSEPQACYAKAIGNTTKSKQTQNKKSGLDLAWEDVEVGRVTRYESTDDMFRKLGLK